MRPVVIGFLLGAIALGFLAGAGAVGLAIAADAGEWPSFRLALGPVLLLDFERRGGATEATFGSGIAVVALAGGLVNAGGAALLRRRRT